jgi:hypothetical protein
MDSTSKGLSNKPKIMSCRQDLGKICSNYIYDYIGYISSRSYLHGMILGLLESPRKYLWLDATLGAQPCAQHFPVNKKPII